MDEKGFVLTFDVVLNSFALLALVGILFLVYFNIFSFSGENELMKKHDSLLFSTGKTLTNQNCNQTEELFSSLYYDYNSSSNTIVVGYCN